LLALLAACAFFASQSDRFLSGQNFSLILQQVMVVGVLAIGQTLIILTAGIDLSCGMVMALGSVVMTKLAVDSGVPPVLAVICGVGVTALFGFINGLLVTRIKLPSFIVTLGTMNIAFAITQIYSSSQTVTDLPPILTALGNTFRLGETELNYGTLLMLFLYWLAWFLLRNTASGRHVYAVGNAPEAARLTGIATNKVLLGVYTMAGALYGVAALLAVARTGVGDPDWCSHRRRFSQWPYLDGGGIGVSDFDHWHLGHFGGIARPNVSEARIVMAGYRIVMQATGLVKRYGQVTALDGADFELRAGEILAVIGDNGAGKSSLIKALSGATIPDQGFILLDNKPVNFKSPIDARKHGIETVYQDLAVAPAMTIAENLFLGRELRKPGIAGSLFRLIDKRAMLEQAAGYMQELKIGIRSMTQPLETLSGGQRQGVAVARSAAFAKHVVILDEPTAALGVKEGNMVLELIRRVRDKGLPVILISHNMPHVFEIADRIHIQRLGKRAAVVNPKAISMSDTVAIMTGAKPVEDIPASALA
jgi:fructose transport system ATP-binding protein